MKIRNQFWALGVMILLHAVPSWGQSVIRAGAEWLQPADFTGVAANEVGAACPPPTYVCTGLVKGVDLDGFIWASTPQEFDRLFSTFGAPTFPDTVNDEKKELDSEWAPAILSAFSPTNSLPTRNELVMRIPAVNGVPLASFPCTYLDQAYVDDRAPGSEDALEWEDIDTACDDDRETEGFLFYRPLTTPPPVAVPTMNLYGLLITILTMLAIGSFWHSRTHREGGR